MNASDSSSSSGNILRSSQADSNMLPVGETYSSRRSSTCSPEAPAATAHPSTAAASSSLTTTTTPPPPPPPTFSFRRGGTGAATACFLLLAVACTRPLYSDNTSTTTTTSTPARQTKNASPLFRSSSSTLLSPLQVPPGFSNTESERLSVLGVGRQFRDLADADDDGNNNGDDDGANGDDANNGDDAAEEENDQEQQQQGGDDDFFDDFIQDDLVADDDATPVYEDDFYAFEKDRTPKLLPIEPRTVVAFFVISLALSLGASSGTGGGGIIVPIYIIVLSLPIQVAIPIGAVTVLGGSMASTSFNWTRRHPLADRVLIDWDLILVMEPLTLTGALIGTLFHRILSEKVLVVLLVLLLSVTAHTTLSKASRMYMAEIRYIRHLRAAQSEPPSTASPTFPKIHTLGTFDPAVSEPQEVKNASSSRQSSSHNIIDGVEKEEILILNPDFVTLRSELMEQEKFTPRSKIIAVCLVMAVITFLNVMVGGGSYNSPWDIICGSVAFWVVHVIMIAFLIASAWAAQTYVVARHEVKELVRFDYVHGDIKWDTRSAIIYPAVFVTAGLFAGTLGIGGGIITVPIMLAMGVHPGVVSATSSAMILFTSFASVTAFWIFGLILEDFAVVAFIVGFCATFIGQLFHRQARQARSASGRDFERNSYTAFAIGAVVLVSALFMTVEYVFTIVEEPEDKGGMCDGLRF